MLTNTSRSLAQVRRRHRQRWTSRFGGTSLRHTPTTANTEKVIQELLKKLAVAIALAIVLVPAGPRRRNLEMIAAGSAVIMGLSRVYLRAHWLSDVIAGVALGAAMAIGVAVVMHYIVSRGGGQKASGRIESEQSGA